MAKDETAVKGRPPRIFYSKTKKAYYIKNGDKKKYFKLKGGMTYKELLAVVVKFFKTQKKRRPKAKPDSTEKNKSIKQPPTTSLIDRTGEAKPATTEKRKPGRPRKEDVEKKKQDSVKNAKELEEAKQKLAFYGPMTSSAWGSSASQSSILQEALKDSANLRKMLEVLNAKLDKKESKTKVELKTELKENQKAQSLDPKKASESEFTKLMESMAKDNTNPRMKEWAESFLDDRKKAASAREAKEAEKKAREELAEFQKEMKLKEEELKASIRLIETAKDEAEAKLGKNIIDLKIKEEDVRLALDNLETERDAKRDEIKVIIDEMELTRAESKRLLKERTEKLEDEIKETRRLLTVDLDRTREEIKQATESLAEFERKNVEQEKENRRLAALVAQAETAAREAAKNRDLALEEFNRLGIDNDEKEQKLAAATERLRAASEDLEKKNRDLEDTGRVVGKSKAQLKNARDALVALRESREKQLFDKLGKSWHAGKAGGTALSGQWKTLFGEWDADIDRGDKSKALQSLIEDKKGYIRDIVVRIVRGAEITGDFDFEDALEKAKREIVGLAADVERAKINGEPPPYENEPIEPGIVEEIDDILGPDGDIKADAKAEPEDRRSIKQKALDELAKSKSSSEDDAKVEAPAGVPPPPGGVPPPPPAPPGAPDIPGSDAGSVGDDVQRKIAEIDRKQALDLADFKAEYEKEIKDMEAEFEKKKILKENIPEKKYKELKDAFETRTADRIAFNNKKKDKLQGATLTEEEKATKAAEEKERKKQAIIAEKKAAFDREQEAKLQNLKTGQVSAIKQIKQEVLDKNREKIVKAYKAEYKDASGKKIKYDVEFEPTDKEDKAKTRAEKAAFEEAERKKKDILEAYVEAELEKLADPLIEKRKADDEKRTKKIKEAEFQFTEAEDTGPSPEELEKKRVAAEARRAEREAKRKELEELAKDPEKKAALEEARLAEEEARKAKKEEDKAAEILRAKNRLKKREDTPDDAAREAKRIKDLQASEAENARARAEEANKPKSTAEKKKRAKDRADTLRKSAERAAKLAAEAAEAERQAEEEAAAEEAAAAEAAKPKEPKPEAKKPERSAEEAMAALDAENDAQIAAALAEPAAKEPEEPKPEPKEPEEPQGGSGRYEYSHRAPITADGRRLKISKYITPYDIHGWGKKPLKQGPIGLSTSDINDIMLKYAPVYKGTFAANQWAKYPFKLSDKIAAFVVNTDPSNKPGKHWVAVFIDFVNHTVEYFDPLGDDVDLYFLQQLDQMVDKMNPSPKAYLKLKVNNIKRQRENSSTCGFHSMHFLIKRILGEPFKTASLPESDILQSERQIKKMMKQYGYV